MSRWDGLPLEHLRTSGTDNALWRVRDDRGGDVVVRLPRRPGAGPGIEAELRCLRHLAGTPLASVVGLPTIRHEGSACEVFPQSWAVLDWLEGDDAWSARAELDADPAGLTDLAVALAGVVRSIEAVTAAPVPRRAGSRGGPVGPLLESLDGWLGEPRWRASDLLDVAAVRRVAHQAREVAGEATANTLVHGDLIPGNVLVDGGRLAAVIDWGGAGLGDPAQDLAPAWSLFEGRAREAFRAAVGADEAAWTRGRLFELEHAVGGVLYYVPRRHPLGDVMARTLARILHDGG